jgi:hypothetical protein
MWKDGAGKSKTRDGGDSFGEKSRAQAEFPAAGSTKLFLRNYALQDEGLSRWHVR